MLVNDCGGHGSALEVLQEILKGRDIQNVNINDMMNDLCVRLHDRYCEALHIPGTNKYSDHIVQPELIRYVRKSNSSMRYFDLSYIWIWILTSSSDGKDPILRDWFFCDYGDHRNNKNPKCPLGSQFWQYFEHFVASFRTLKSRNLNDDELTSISKIHIGTRLNGDFEFKNHHLELECVVHREDTNSSNYGKGKKDIKCEDKTVDVHECNYFIINGVSASYGDVFLELDTSGKPNEKSASSKDFFILFITTKCLDIILPKNSGIVDASNWDKYFSPYSGRAYAYADIGPLNINKVSRRDLLLVYGIGEIWADKIMAKREYKDIED
ncbi:19030_t:CDS:2, partial [Funneliformis geosporum]